MSEVDFFRGRKLLLKEIPPVLRRVLASPKIVVLPTMKRRGSVIQCIRCGSQHRQDKVYLKNEYTAFYYCPSCIQLGRVQSNQTFYYVPEKKNYPRRVVYEFQGKLSPSQKKVSRKLLQVAEEKNTHLIHAVTGAGKTEMLFETIHASLERGERVGIVSPRVDVCLELFPRLSKIFPKEKIALLHGQQREVYAYTSLVIATTHQMLRFYHAFDVMIVDEIDAFPYVGNPILEFGVSRARKKKSSLLYLTATPTDELKNQTKAKLISYSRVPVRYHGYPLPVPKVIWDYTAIKKVRRGMLPSKLEGLLMKQFENNRITLLFCPTVRIMKNLYTVIQNAFPKRKIDYAHANDSKRHRKVEEMRNREYDLLLTTTILERGVTFVDIDVIVFDSGHEVFNQASLVQIAGRAGRNQDYPHGNVYFIHNGWSIGMKKAINEIEAMNAEAKERNLLNI